MTQRRLLPALLVASLLLVAYPATAHAYLDPASGSILLQVILGGLAGATLFIKMYWRRLLGVLGLRKDENDQASS